MKPAFQRVALAAVLGFGLVVSAAAQDRGPGPGGVPGPRGGDRQKQVEDRQHRREQRLHDLLQIKPDQEAAFRTFVSSLDQRRAQRDRRAGVQGQQRTRLTTPERLDRSLQRLAEAQQRLQKEAEAVKAFYAALSSEQRTVLDEFGVRALRGDGGLRLGGRRGRFGRPPFR